MNRRSRSSEAVQQIMRLKEYLKKKCGLWWDANQAKREALCTSTDPSLRCETISCAAHFWRSHFQAIGIDPCVLCTYVGLSLALL